MTEAKDVMPCDRERDLRRAPTWRLRPRAPMPGTVLGPAAAIADGEGREYRFGAGPSAFSMLVVRRGEAVRGYLNLCPHFSLPLNARAGQFTDPERGLVMCFNHFALFRFEDGACIEGACEGEALDPVPVEIVEGLIRIVPEGAVA